jgi:hypothetical protein
MTDDRVRSGPEGSALQLVVFDLEGQRYGLPVAAVDRALPMVSVSSLPQAPGINTIFPCSRGGRRRQPIFDSPGGPNCPRPSC